MIATFPDLYPEELFYSGCARYYARMGYYKSTVTKKLFGRISRINFGLPSGLDYFISQLPIDETLKVEDLIFEHTLFPFYAPFLPVDKRNQLYLDMRSRGRKKPTQYIGNYKPIGLSASNHFRYCPLCVEDNLRSYGETYWNRNHQLPGVDVCYRHAIFLNNSNYPLTNDNKQNLFLAEKIEIIHVEKPIDINLDSHKYLLMIAQEAYWLMNQREYLPGILELRQKYLSLMEDKGYATRSGKVNVDNLVKDITSFYSNDLLSEIRCSMNYPNDRQYWPLNLVWVNANASHPISHVLLAVFLSGSVKKTFESSTEPKPFGEPPWPCMNNFCNHYLESVIEDVKIKVFYSKSIGRPRCIRGVFSCKWCGYKYSRIRQDRCEEQQFKIETVLAFGFDWEKKFIELWENKNISIYTIAKNLGVNSQRLAREAQRLNLTPRHYQQIEKQQKPQKNDQRKTFEETREYCRTQWINALVSDPSLGVTRLREKYHLIKEYSWLLRNDKIWLNEHRPSIIVGEDKSTNYDVLDSELSKKIEPAAENIKESSGYPQQVTRKMICQDIGINYLLKYQLDKLPNTSMALKCVMESSSDYSNRKMEWTYEYFREEKRVPSYTAFCVIAKIDRANQKYKELILNYIVRLEMEIG